MNMGMSLETFAKCMGAREDCRDEMSFFSER